MPRKAAPGVGVTRDWRSFHDADPRGARRGDLHPTLFSHFFRVSGTSSTEPTAGAPRDLHLPANRVDASFAAHVRDLCLPYGSDALFCPQNQDMVFHQMQLADHRTAGAGTAAAASSSSFSSATAAADDLAGTEYQALHGTVLTVFRRSTAPGVSLRAIAAHKPLLRDFLDFLTAARKPEVKTCILFYVAAYDFFAGCSGKRPYDNAFVDPSAADAFRAAASNVVGSVYEIVAVGPLKELVDQCVAVSQDHDGTLRPACLGTLWLRLEEVLATLETQLIGPQVQAWRESLGSAPEVPVEVRGTRKSP
jgi:hypothetical protein